MKTPFFHALKICGLSNQEAAEYFKSDIGTVKKWSSGHRPVPNGVWAELATLYQHIASHVIEKAEVMEKLYESGKKLDDKIVFEINLHNDTKASEKGYPFASTHGAEIALTLLEIDPDILEDVKTSFTEPEANDN